MILIWLIPTIVVVTLIIISFIFIGKRSKTSIVEAKKKWDIRSKNITGEKAEELVNKEIVHMIKKQLNGKE